MKTTKRKQLFFFNEEASASEGGSVDNTGGFIALGCGRFK